LSSPRARANHELYLAKIVLGAWQRELEREQIPASTLALAFHGGAREHLVFAYGWFLLSICNVEETPQKPPRSCQQLPPMPEGRVFPAQINELKQLEAAGWLGEMLRANPPGTPVARQPGNLVFDAGASPGTLQVERWLDQLESLFDRMGDSLDEY